MKTERKTSIKIKIRVRKNSLKIPWEVIFQGAVFLGVIFRDAIFFGGGHFLRAIFRG